MNIGDIIKCTVTGFKDYGIFVKINEEYNGLIHISEISEAYVRNVEDYSEIGEEIYAKIVEINEDTKQIKLSIKDLNYKIDGSNITNTLENGFLPLKEKLNDWVKEKLKELQ